VRNPQNNPITGTSNHLYSAWILNHSADNAQNETVTAMTRYTVTVAAPFEETVANIIGILNQRKFQVVRSFDLTNALGPDTAGCTCPDHGTEACTCCYTVLLVYAPDAARAPYTTTIHTSGPKTYVTLCSLDRGSAADASAEESVLQALVGACRPKTQNSHSLFDDKEK
jgi:hypothetical protein